MLSKASPILSVVPGVALLTRVILFNVHAALSKSTVIVHNNFSDSHAFTLASPSVMLTETVLDKAEVVFIVHNFTGYPSAFPFETTTFVTEKLCVLFAAAFVGI
jgi:hypothetical protein